MSKDILFVTNNEGKVKEIKPLLASFGYNVISLKDANIDTEVVEDANTFKGNALLKARYFKDRYDIVIADDSGLEISCLNNLPGVFSSRFIGSKISYEFKNQQVIKLLENCQNRKARFISVIALVYNNSEKVFVGEIAGSIATSVLGNAGFGYDPIFVPEGYNQSFGQLDLEVKNQISHRSIAINKLMEYFKNERI